MNLIDDEIPSQGIVLDVIITSKEMQDIQNKDMLNREHLQSRNPYLLRDDILTHHVTDIK